MFKLPDHEVHLFGAGFQVHREQESNASLQL